MQFLILHYYNDKMNERTDLIINKQEREIINKTLFVLAGLGGVGGTALEVILRFGALNYYLIDGDIFEESNLNRQILSKRDNIGSLKTEEGEKHIRDLSPNSKIKICSEMIKAENIEKIYKDIKEFYKDNVLEKIVLLDCIDDVRAKIILYKAFLDTDSIIVSSMGAGRNFSAPLVASSLDKTHSCPLAREVRYEARKNLDEQELKKIKAVFSPVPVTCKEKNGIIPSSVIQTFNTGVRVAEEALRALLDINN